MHRKVRCICSFVLCRVVMSWQWYLKQMMLWWMFLCYKIKFATLVNANNSIQETPHCITDFAGGGGTAVNTHCALHYNCSDSSLCIQSKKGNWVCECMGWGTRKWQLSVDCYERKDSKWSKTYYGVTSLMITLQYPYITFWKLDDSCDIQYSAVIGAWSVA